MASEQYGMTSRGFIPKRLVDIQTSINTKLADIVDEKTGERPFQNAEDDTILQQVVGVFSAELAEAWGAAYDGSVQFNPLFNTGAGQEGTVQLNAITKNAGTKSIIAVELIGAPGVIATKGSSVGPLSGETQWTLNSNLLFPAATEGESETTVSGYATCTEFGPHDPEPGTINTIQTPIAGWFGVSNISTESVGTDQETEAALRKRQQQSTALTSYRQVDAIRAAILNVEGVTYCRVYQNPTVNPVDDRGIPFKEVAPVVVGGDPLAIAEAMAIRLPTGQLGFGSTPITLTDQQGIAYPYSFSRPIEIPVYVDIIVRITDSSEFPSGTAIDDIKNAVVAYAKDIDDGRGFQPGEDVIRTRLYTPVNTIPGHQIVSLTIGTSSDALTESNITILWNQASDFDVSRINVTVQV